MDNTTATILGILVIVLIAAGVWFALRKRRSQGLREHFGPEYHEAVKRHGDPARAEAELASRQKRVAKLDIRPLPPPERDQFGQRWSTVQASFVDSPPAAVAEAAQLVVGLMQAMGYPMGDFEQRAADISVDHPEVVKHYRIARKIAKASEEGQATTEDLREAMIHYRVLFEDLLLGTGNNKEVTNGRPVSTRT